MDQQVNFERLQAWLRSRGELPYLSIQQAICEIHAVRYARKARIIVDLGECEP